MSTLREAAQQALAFTMRDFATVRDFEAARAVLHDTLKAALAQPQEHEPLSVEALGRALVASRVIDAAAIDDPEGYDDGVMLERVRGLHRRLAALAQQEQAPDLRNANPIGLTPPQKALQREQFRAAALAQQEQKQEQS